MRGPSQTARPPPVSGADDGGSPPEVACSGVGRQQPDRPGTDEDERIEVVVASTQSPVQACTREAVAGSTLQGPDDRAAPDVVADVHLGGDRFVGGPDAAVVDHHDSAAGEVGGEGHGAGQRGVHVLPRVPEQVDAAVTATEPGGGRVEPVDDVGAWGQGPDPLTGGLGSQRPGGRVRRREDRQRRREKDRAESG